MLAQGLLILLLLILINGVFSLSEMSVVSSRKARLKEKADKGKYNYRIALKTAEAPGKFLSTIQIGITLIGILAGAFGEATLSRSLAEVLAGLPWLAKHAEPISIAVVVLGTTFVSVIFGELVPKRIALLRPEPIAAFMVVPMRFLALLFAPVVRFLTSTTELVLWLLRVKPSDEPPVTEEELRVLIAQGTEAGVFDQREKDMVEGVLYVGDKRISAFMTPRTEIDIVKADATPEAVRDLVIANRQLRVLPVCISSLDDMIGVIQVSDIIHALATGTYKDFRDYMIKPLMFPASSNSLKIFSVLRESHFKAVFAVDEYGGIEGMVTLGDLAEAILGEIKLKGVAEEPEILKREDGSYLIDGYYPADKFFRFLKTYPDEQLEFHTLAGFALSKLGRIPTTGERFEWEDYVFEIMDMDGNRIDKLLVFKPKRSGPIQANYL